MVSAYLQCLQAQGSLKCSSVDLGALLVLRAAPAGVYLSSSCGNCAAPVGKLLIPAYAVQVQYSLLDRRPENFMIPYCKEHNIKLLPYGTVAGGFLSERYLGVPTSK